MSLLGKLAVAVLGLLLSVALVASLVVGTAHLTVLDPGFVTTTMEEEDAYEVVTEQMVAAAGSGGSTAGSGGNTTDSGPGLDRQALVREVIDEEYVANQTEINVGRLYAYLHGKRDEPNLTVDLRPVKDDASDAVAAEVRNRSIADLLGTAGVSLPGPVNATLLDRMTASESGYESARADFRAALRERVLDRLVEEAFTSADEDELLALVIDDYDPNDYSESEKEAMVAERETEIRAALRDRIERERGDEIDRRIQDRLDQISEQTGNATGDTELQRAAIDLQSAVVRGLTTDTSYETFRTDYEGAKDRLATAAGDRVAATLREQLPDRIDLSETMGPAATRQLETARTGVQWLDRLAFVAPAVVAVLLGLLYLATGAVTAVARTFGVSLLWVGLPTYLSLGFVRSKALATLQSPGGGGGGAAMDLAVAVFDRLLGTVGALTLTMTLAGGLLVVGSVLAGRGYVDAARERFQ